MERLELPAWQARLVAKATHALPLAGARWVDEQLAARTTGFGGVVLDRLVAEAAARFDPEVQEEREDRAQDSWDVQLHHLHQSDFTGTSELFARGDSLDLTKFHDLVSAVAACLRAMGDDSPLGVRKAKALGVIADLASGQATLDLQSVGSTPKNAGKVKVHVRVDADDLDVDAERGSAVAVGDVERLGPATLKKIRDWVGHSHVIIQPVLDLSRDDAVDVHDPPEWMRELVMLRDGHCAFPGCTRDARSCDVDHIKPYVDPGDGGPPGQTNPHNLACLCRRHHRAKTLGLWRYTPRPQGQYLWHGPLGRSYLVTAGGTVTISVG